MNKLLITIIILSACLYFAVFSGIKEIKAAGVKSIIITDSQGQQTVIPYTPGMTLPSSSGTETASGGTSDTSTNSSGETYTYYSSGLMHTKTTSDGTTYEYSDQNYGGQGFGLLIKQVNPDGSYKTLSDYFSGTSQAHYVSEYDKSGNLKTTYEYNSSGVLLSKDDAGGSYYTYYPSGRMESKKGPDGTIFEYTDENYNSEGYGLITRKTNLDGSYQTFSDYFAGTRFAKYIKDYDYTDNLLVTYEYDSTGLLVAKAETGGDSYTYYSPSGFTHTKTSSGGTIYEYTNENYNSEGYGLLTKQTNADASYKIFSDYFAGTRQAQFVKEYNSSGTLLNTCEYDSAGNLKTSTQADGTSYAYYLSGRMYLKMPPDGTKYEYTDQNYNSEGYGLLTKQTNADASYKTFSDYFAGTRQAQYIKEYDSSDNLLVSYEYDSGGHMVGKTQGGVSYTYYNPSGLMQSKSEAGTTYQYTDENYNFEGYGLLTKQINPDGSFKTFLDYFAGTRYARYVKEYDSTWSLMHTYEYDSSGNFVGSIL